jgi:hypothetical protein
MKSIILIASIAALAFAQRTPSAPAPTSIVLGNAGKGGNTTNAVNTTKLGDDLVGNGTLDGLGDKIAEGFGKMIGFVACIPDDAESCSKSYGNCATNDEKCGCANINKIYSNCFSDAKVKAKGSNCTNLIGEMKQSSLDSCKQKGYATDQKSNAATLTATGFISTIVLLMFQ